MHRFEHNALTSEDLVQSLQKAFNTGGPNCRGLQINTPRNMSWTPATPVEKFVRRNPDVATLIQTTRSPICEMNGRPDKIADSYTSYQGTADRFIIDLSAGNAVPASQLQTQDLQARRPITHPDQQNRYANTVHVIKIDEYYMIQLREATGKRLPQSTKKVVFPLWEYR